MSKTMSRQRRIRRAKSGGRSDLREQEDIAESGFVWSYEPTSMTSVYELNFDQSNMRQRWQRVREYWKLLQE